MSDLTNFVVTNSKCSRRISNLAQRHETASLLYFPFRDSRDVTHTETRTPRCYRGVSCRRHCDTSSRTRVRVCVWHTAWRCNARSRRVCVYASPCDTARHRVTPRRVCNCAVCTAPRVRAHACVRARAWPCVREGKRSARKRGTGKEKRTACFCVGQYLHASAFRRTDGRVAADRSVPILVRLSTSLSLRNRTKPVSRHFGANQWRTGATVLFSFSVPRRRLYHAGLSLRVRLGKRDQKPQGRLLPLLEQPRENRRSSQSIVADAPLNQMRAWSITIRGIICAKRQRCIRLNRSRYFYAKLMISEDVQRFSLFFVL